MDGRQPLHVPLSLKKTKKTKRRTLSHRDIANIIHVQKNTNLLRHHRNTRNPPRFARDDFITMYLVKWPLPEIVKATSLIISIINRSNHPFSNTAPFLCVNKEGHFDTVCYRVYYNLLYETTLEQCRNNESLSGTDHNISLLRACFVIGFIHDERIRRFVMANHSIHTDYTLTKPPSTENAIRFINECRSTVDAYLTYGDEYEEMNILSMIKTCVSSWIRLCMI